MLGKRTFSVVYHKKASKRKNWRWQLKDEWGVKTRIVYRNGMFFEPKTKRRVSSAANDDRRLGPLPDGERRVFVATSALGALTVGLFLASITAAVSLAPYCTPSLSEIERDEKAKLSQSLADYIKKGEFIVRVDI